MVTEEAKHHLHKTMSWFKFLAVLTFIGAGFMALYGVFMLIMSFVSSEVMMIILTIFMLIMSVLYFYMGACMNKFIQTMINALMQGSTELFTLAMKAQRRLITFVGIFVIISFVLGVVVSIITVLGGMGTADTFLKGYMDSGW